MVCSDLWEARCKVFALLGDLELVKYAQFALDVPMRKNLEILFFARAHPKSSMEAITKWGGVPAEKIAKLSEILNLETPVQWLDVNKIIVCYSLPSSQLTFTPISSTILRPLKVMQCPLMQLHIRCMCPQLQVHGYCSTNSV
jgi:hypothetical protein